jgi:hypothetical protein
VIEKRISLFLCMYRLDLILAQSQFQHWMPSVMCLNWKNSPLCGTVGLVLGFVLGLGKKLHPVPEWGAPNRHGATRECPQRGGVPGENAPIKNLPILMKLGDLVGISFI